MKNELDNPNVFFNENKGLLYFYNRNSDILKK